MECERHSQEGIHVAFEPLQLPFQFQKGLQN